MMADVTEYSFVGCTGLYTSPHGSIEGPRSSKFGQLAGQKSWFPYQLIGRGEDSGQATSE